jgi:hypothetical protein
MADILLAPSPYDSDGSIYSQDVINITNVNMVFPTDSDILYMLKDSDYTLIYLTHGTGDSAGASGGGGGGGGGSEASNPQRWIA